MLPPLLPRRRPVASRRSTRGGSPVRVGRRRSRAAARLVPLAVLAALVSGVVAVGGAAAATTAVPRGWVLPLSKDGAGFAITGWAAPADPAGTARVRVDVDGVRVGRLVADQSAPWVARRRPRFGPDHGFHGRFDAPAGTHTVCAFVVGDPATPTPTPLNCRTITLAYDPTGAVDTPAVTPGTLTVSGWAVDPDAVTTPVVVVLWLDHHPVARQRADQPRDDVTVAAAGNDHGYSLGVPVTEGVHRVCVRVKNIGPGENIALGCSDLDVSFSPSGRLTRVVRRPSGVAIGGWAADPDTKAPVRVVFTADGKPLGAVRADQASRRHPGHGFWVTFPMPDTSSGVHRFCAVARNRGTFGEDTDLACVRKDLSWNPVVHLSAVTQKSPGALVTGWARDPDTSAPIRVVLTADGARAGRVRAGGPATDGSTGGPAAGHSFATVLPLPEGHHTICVVARNVLAGDADSSPACATVTLAFSAYGAFESLTRSSDGTGVVATGWAIDPDTRAPIQVQLRIDGGRWAKTATAGVRRPDVLQRHPDAGARHGFAVTLRADAGEHDVCVRAVGVDAGKAYTSLGCRIINAVHPTVPGSVTGVSASAGYGGAQVSWQAPATDGGAPWTKYTVTARPGGRSVTVGADQLTATVLGLQPATTYTFSVVATNVAGSSVPAASPAVTTQNEPPAQTTPAPVSTSRYIRNISGSGRTDLATMRAEGVADARANPSGHAYLVLLDIGGQVEASQGVILSAGIRYVSYTDLVKCLDAYIDGYSSAQRASAPVTVALGANNDIDVSRSSGASWARHVVVPVLNHAARYPGITIAGADDIEPGFRAGYSASAAWVHGYLAATTAPFVFNGSADGCAWSSPNGGCNNGWTARGLQWLAGGTAPLRIVNLPQVYNTTMAAQWRYISLTGVESGLPRINFGGALTEYVACQQAGGCGSLTPRSAWQALWQQLRAQPELRPHSLPYATDLRIDR